MTILSPKRQFTPKVFKKHIERAIEELDDGYQVDLQDKFEITSIRTEIEATPRGGSLSWSTTITH